MRLCLCLVLAWSGACTTQGAPPYASSAAISEPRPYAEGALATVNGLAFESDGRTVYVSRWTDDLDDRGRRRVRIFRHRFVDDGWSAPEPMPFSSSFTDYQPVLSPDGTRLFFTSTRPPPGTSIEARQNVWFVDRAGADWGTPSIVTELVSSGWDGYAVPTVSGRLYYVSERAGGHGAVDIWVADPAGDGHYAEPRNVAVLNSEDSDSDLYVDPWERFIIFNRYVESTADMQFWIAFGEAGDWHAPRLLDEVNGPGWELSPTVTPDGRYFFFNRDDQIYQMDFCALVRPEEMTSSCVPRPTTDGAL